MNILEYSSILTNYIDNLFEGKPAWKIAASSAGTIVAIFWIKNILTDQEGITLKVKKKALKLIRKLPRIRNKIENELNKLSNNMIKEMNDNICNDPYVVVLPNQGLSRQSILDKTKKYSAYGHFDWQKGFTSGTVYNGDADLTALMTEVYGLSVWTNPLHSDIFPGIRKMEAEVVRMCCSLFSGSEKSCGVMTTGGTESIILAMKAFRDYGREVKGIRRPEVVVPLTAHAAFDKGAQMLNMLVRHAEIDPVSMKVKVESVKKLINRNTCMIVGSAPQFPHGVIDPIRELGALGMKHGIPVHVDACLGGFLIPFAKEAGFDVAPFDFSVPGVSSISCDTHKYGYTPKGSSVIMYSDVEYRHYQYFVVPDWPGGIYATPTIAGSRTGAVIAASWAAMMYYGREGYVDCTRKILQTTKKIEAACRNIAGIEVMGWPEVCVVAVKSDKFNIYSISDAMTKKGWNLNALQFPSCVHIAVTLLHTKEGVADRFIADLKAVTNDLFDNPPSDDGPSAAIYGMAQSLPDRSIVEDCARCYLDSCYSTASIN